MTQVRSFLPQMNSKEEKILDTAISLFLEHGFHATGIDTIVAKSGITKRTLYKHFNSKEGLIIAALKKHHTDFLTNFGAGVLAQETSPKAQILAIFDVAEAWFEAGKKFQGCFFINAIGEFTDDEGQIRQEIQKFKNHVQAFIKDLAKQAKLPSPEVLSKQIALLLEGAIVVAQTSGNAKSAQEAKTIAAQLIGGQ